MGFEPTDHLTEVNALAGRPIRPLWHLSERAEVYLKCDVVTQSHPDNLDDGTVAEWTNAPALKAGGRKARGFESLPFRCVMSRVIEDSPNPHQGSGCLFFGVRGLFRGAPVPW